MGRSNGTRPIDRVVAVYQRDRHRIDVPEWGEDDKPMVMYVAPLTSQDMGKVRELTDGRDDYMENCYLVAVKAEAEDGSKLFSIADAARLYSKGDFILLQRIANNIYASALAKEESAKAIKEDPTSGSS